MSISVDRLKNLLILTFCVFLVAATGCTPTGQEQAGENGIEVNIQGTWKGSAQQTGSSNPTFTLKLNQREKQEVWGTITSMDGTFDEAIISGGKLAGNRLTFSATANGSNFRNGRSYTFEAEVNGNKMNGTWKDILERSRGPFTTEKVVKTSEEKTEETTAAPE